MIFWCFRNVNHGRDKWDVIIPSRGESVFVLGEVKKTLKQLLEEVEAEKKALKYNGLAWQGKYDKKNLRAQRSMSRILEFARLRLTRSDSELKEVCRGS